MLKDKVVVVTGAGSGIGRAAAMMFAGDGAKVALIDRNEDAARAVSEEIGQAGGESLPLGCDVSKEAEVEKTIDAVIQEWGRIDGAFNNAGIELHSKSVPDLTADEWRKVIDVNLTGIFLCMKFEIAAMRGTGGGAIVNTASAGAIATQPNMAEYASSKAGILGLTRAGAAEFGETKVRVNAVLPGLILTPMTEDRLFSDPNFAAAVDPLLRRHSIGRFGKPADVAEAVRWLLSDHAGFINGVSLPVDGGFTAG
ncbi:SDR family NAD(P)-dependent oxidoreductase [Sphingomonas sp. ID0503]|uniref:SDR family NAD(P)-dependent oxidoreductase n=1 Tax=Sphingomonas sp. ID0503 TaxID=3399691 RepID=UPI003AFA3B6C